MRLRNDVTWTYEDENFLFLREANADLAVYNLGAYVKKFPESQYGFGGNVISKKSLQINFARNDILTDYCTTWRKINGVLKKFAASARSKKASLTSAERRSILNSFWSEDVSYQEIRNAKLLRDATGTYRSFAEILSFSTLSFAYTPVDITNGDKLIQARQAMVLRASELDQLDLFHAESFGPSAFLEILGNLMYTGVEVEEIIESMKCNEGEFDNDDLEHARDYEKLCKITLANIADISRDIDHGYKVLDLAKQSPTIKATIAGLKSAIDQFAVWNFSQTSPELARKCDSSERRAHSKYLRRDILVVKNNLSEAFTDGGTFIGFDIKVLKSFADGKTSVDKLLHLMVHECCHDEATNNTHLHSPEFHEKFHVLIMSKGFDRMRSAFERTFRKLNPYDGPLFPERDSHYNLGWACFELIRNNLGSTFRLLPTTAWRLLCDQFEQSFLLWSNDGKNSPWRPAVNYAYWARHQKDEVQGPDLAPLKTIDAIIEQTMPADFHKLPKRKINLLRNALATALIDNIELEEFRKIVATKALSKVEEAAANQEREAKWRWEAEERDREAIEKKKKLELEIIEKSRIFTDQNADVLSPIGGKPIT